MEEFTLKIISSTNPEDINKIEMLRKQVFHLKLNTINRYEFHIVNGVIIPFAFFKDDEPVAGCYVGEAFGNLYIYFLFVREDYQHTGLRLGRQLLQYVNDNKKIIEQRLGKTFNTSALHPSSENTRKLYKKIGYDDTNMGMMVKNI